MELLRPSLGLHRLYRSCSRRNMADTNKTDLINSSNHLQRTAENTRHEMSSLATVIEMRDESKTVKSLSLKVHNNQIIFKAGQWVDMFIPGVDTVGGFSMYSSPTKLQQTGLLDLAVKYSKHPPAHWIHTQCLEGSEVAIRVGGDFFYDPASQDKQDVLLVAGGVGINPLYSIINHVIDLKSKGDQSDHSSSISQRVILLYSAKTEDDLLFKGHLDAVQHANTQLRCRYHVTKESVDNNSQNITGQRIGQDDISRCFDWLRKDQLTVYLCGPSPMLTDMEKLLIDQGISKCKIHYEKWW